MCANDVMYALMALQLVFDTRAVVAGLASAACASRWLLLAAFDGVTSRHKVVRTDFEGITAVNPHELSLRGTRVRLSPEANESIGRHRSAPPVLAIV